MKYLYILVLLISDFILNAQNINVRFVYYIDSNQDCIKQGNEDSFFMNQRHIVSIKNNLGNISSYIINDSANMIASFNLSLEKQKSFSIRIQFDSIVKESYKMAFAAESKLILKFNCINLDSFWSFGTKSNDTLIYLPLSMDSSAYKIPDFFQGATFLVKEHNRYSQSIYHNKCPNDSLYETMHFYMKPPYIFQRFYISDWGDGYKDTTYILNRLYIAPKHKFNKPGTYNVKFYLWNPNYDKFLVDSFYVHVSHCNIILGKVYIDSNNNCAFDNEKLFSNYDQIGTQDTSVIIAYKKLDSIINIFYLDSNGKYISEDTINYNFPTGVFNYDTGTYYISLRNLKRYFSCQDTVHNGKGYKKFKITGYNQRLYIDLGISDSTFLITKSLSYLKKTICNGDTTYNTLNVEYNGSIKVIAKWGDGFIDSFSNITSNSLNFKHKHPSNGSYRTVILITDKNFKVIDSFVDSIKTATCFNLTGNIFIDTNKNCIFDSEQKIPNTLLRIFDQSNLLMGQDTTDNNGNFSLNQGLAIGAYKVQISKRFLNCSSGADSNGDFFSFNINSGSSNVLEIPIKDTTYVLSKQAKFSNTIYCVQQPASLNINVQHFGSKLKGYISWGDGKFDTIHVFNPSGQIVPHSFNAVKKYSYKFYLAINSIIVDSITDSIDVQSCYELKGKIFIDNDKNCVYSPGIDDITKNYSIKLLDSNKKIVTILFTDNFSNFSTLIRDSIIRYISISDFIRCNGGKEVSIPKIATGSINIDIPLISDSLDYSILTLITERPFPGDSARLYMGYYGLKTVVPAYYSSSIPIKSRVLRVNGTAGESYGSGRVFMNYTNNIFNKNYLVFKFDTSLTQIDTLCFNIRLNRVNLEPNILNNEVTICLPALNSYDPNDKLVAMRSMQRSGNFTDRNDDILYTVRFQNTGNAPARNIYILDSITYKLDLLTFKYLGSSHNASLSINENRMLRIDFKNINLPDSASNPEGSQGYISYSIKPIQKLDTGELIENVANIYFDFNPPITTNTTKNRFVKKSGSDFNWSSFAQEVYVENLNVYPIPALNNLYFNDSKRKEFLIYDIIGKPIISGECFEKIEISNLKAGIYFILVNRNGKSFQLKFIKE